MSETVANATAKRILLVEDDEAARESIKLLLKIDRHAVVEAKDGMEALELFARQPFDLVITDFFMAGLRGGDLAAKIKQVSPSQPILMISAFSEKLGPSDKQVDALLSKPFSIDELRQTVAKLLG